MKSLANETNNSVTAVAAATPKSAGEDMARNAMRATIIAARATTSTILLKLMANVFQLGKSGKLILISNAIVSASSRIPSSVSNAVHATSNVYEPSEPVVDLTESCPFLISLVKLERSQYLRHIL